MYVLSCLRGYIDTGCVLGGTTEDEDGAKQKSRSFRISSMNH
jgi:hypothetical protein